MRRPAGAAGRGRRGRRAWTAGWRCSSRRRRSPRRAARRTWPRMADSSTSTRPRRLDADRPRGRHRRGRVAAHVRGGERQLDARPTVVGRSARPRRRRAGRARAAASPSGTTATRTCCSSSAFVRGDRLHRPEQLEVDRADRGDDADVGLGDRGQLGDLPRPAHAHLEHEHLGARRRAQDLQRQPDLRVEVRAATRARGGAARAARAGGPSSRSCRPTR